MDECTRHTKCLLTTLAMRKKRNVHLKKSENCQFFHVVIECHSVSATVEANWCIETQ